MNQLHSHSHSPIQAHSPPRQTPLTTPSSTHLLILGAGWTSTFLIPLLTESNISYVATTTTGRNGTTKFSFDPESTDSAPYKVLPRAQTVLITFPIKGKDQMKLLVELYTKTHPLPSNHGNIYMGMERMSMGAPMPFNWILLGSTGIYTNPGWSDNTSDYDKSNARAQAEDFLISSCNGCVLNLAGLYGGARQPWNWVSRVIKDKETVRSKGSLHLVHGQDVARAIISAHWKFKFVVGKRWIITDLHVYDWWELLFEWGDKLTRIWKSSAANDGSGMMGADKGPAPEYKKWVFECMNEEGVRALPRAAESLGRSLDARAFWGAVGVLPIQGRPTWT